MYSTGEQQAYKDAGAYAATSQNVSEAYTAPAKGDGSTVLDRYDTVVITVTRRSPVNTAGPSSTSARPRPIASGPRRGDMQEPGRRRRNEKDERVGAHRG